MKLTNWIAAAGVVIQALSVLFVGVYAVAQLKVETNSLGTSITELSQTVRALGTKVEGISEKYAEHEIKIRVLESKIGLPAGVPMK